MNKSAKHIVVLNIVGLELDHLNSSLLPNIKRIADGGEAARLKPVFPSVTSTVQASILSGRPPSEHGIVANGLFDKINYTPLFWEQSSNLVQTSRIWDIAKQKSTSLNKIAVLFWQ